MVDLVIKFIDSFYFLFKKYLPLKTYRYAVCGGGNLAFDTVLYFVFFQFIVAKQNVDLIIVTLSPHIASLFFVYPITLLTGFLLSRYITFRDSQLSFITQLWRYFLVSVGGIVISYLAMKLFVDVLKFYPTPSRLLIIIIAVTYSYVFQNRFSFKVDAP